MTVLSAHDLVKAYGPQVILDGASVSIEPGERVGLVGVNGSGKSTLARILAGIEAPEGGSVSRRRGAEIAYLAQEPPFDPAETARAVVLGGLAHWSEAKARHDAASQALARGDGDEAALLEAQAEAAADVERHGGWDHMHHVDAIMGHVGVSRPDASMETLSGGDRRRVALARILVAQPDLAILDEPSNHLDAETVEWLERYLLEEHRGALLLITHDRYLLDRVAERTLELSRGKLYSYDGGYEDYLEAKAERLALEARTESNRQNFLRRELEWLRRQPKARSTKQKARIQRAESVKAAPPPRADRALELALETSRSGKTVLELRGVDLERGGKSLVRGLDLIVGQGERLGVVGRNGAGKTSLLAAILGDLAPSKGEVVLGKNTSIAYFDQQRSGLDDEASIFDNVAKAGERGDVRSYLERFLFDPHKQRQPVGSLSGGERARVALAKLMVKSSNLVILDEPTNDLDVATLGALEALLLELDATAIVVTHDRWFLDRVATSILAFEGDGKVTRYAGNYEAFRLQRAAADAARAEAAREAPRRSEPPRAEKPAAQPKAAAKKSLTYAERLELDGIMDRIEAAEAEVGALEAKLSDPTLYATRGGDVAALTASLERARAEASRLTARWEELATKRGGA